MTITFYRSNEKPYGAVSNLFRRPIRVLEAEFPTVEHAYQWLKPRDERVRDWLQAAPAPSLVALSAHAIPSEELDPAALMGRISDALLGVHTRPGWSRLRYPWMLFLQRCKYAPHEDLRELLLGTGQEEIVEAGRINDDAGRRWGRVKGKGENYLPRMMMRVRGELGADRGLPEVVDPDFDARLTAGQEDLLRALGRKVMPNPYGKLFCG